MWPGKQMLLTITRFRQCHNRRGEKRKPQQKQRQYQLHDSLLRVRA